jgi:hypothetical protein
MYWKILVKLPNTKFRENLFSGSPVVPHRQTGGQTNTVKLISVFSQLFTVNTPNRINVAAPVLFFKS